MVNPDDTFRFTRVCCRSGIVLVKTIFFFFFFSCGARRGRLCAALMAALRSVKMPVLGDRYCRCIYMDTYTYILICIYGYAYIYIYIHVCVYLYLYMCMYIPAPVQRCWPPYSASACPWLATVTAGVYVYIYIYTTYIYTAMYVYMNMHSCIHISFYA